MSDLVERLRKQELSNSLPDDGLCSGAADEIERLTEIASKNKIVLSEELFMAFGHFVHQWMYPEMTADYFDKMRLRMNTDPLMRARVEVLVSGTINLLERNGLPWEQGRTE